MRLDMYFTAILQYSAEVINLLSYYSVDFPVLFIHSQE